MRVILGTSLITFALWGDPLARANEDVPLTVSSELSIGLQTFSYGFLAESSVAAPTARLDLVAAKGKYYGVLMVERLLNDPDIDVSGESGSLMREDSDLAIGRVLDPSVFSQRLSKFRLYAFAGYKLGETDVRYDDGFRIGLRESGPFVGSGFAFLFNSYKSTITASLSYGHLPGSRLEIAQEGLETIVHKGTARGSSAVVKLVHALNSSTRIGLSARYLSYDMDAGRQPSLGDASVLVEERNSAFFLGVRKSLR